MKALTEDVSWLKAINSTVDNTVVPYMAKAGEKASETITNAATTPLGMSVGAASIGLLGARLLAKRRQRKQQEEDRAAAEDDPLKDVIPNNSMNTTKANKLEWENKKNIREQNENLPRYPELSIVPLSMRKKVPINNPQSVANVNMRRRQNVYDTNAENKDTELDQQTAESNIRRQKIKAQVGVDIGPNSIGSKMA